MITINNKKTFYKKIYTLRICNVFFRRRIKNKNSGSRDLPVGMHEKKSLMQIEQCRIIDDKLSTTEVHKVLIE